MTIRIITALTVPAVLSACMAGEPSEVDQLTRDFANAVKYDDAFGETGEAALAQINAMSGQRVTHQSGVPVSGSAEYKGNIGIGTAEEGVIGDMTVTATFGNGGSIDGSATNFVDRSATPVSGTLTISGGDIDASVDPEEEWQVTGTRIEGTLGSGDTQMDVSGYMNGDFLGSGAAHFNGEVRSTGGSLGEGVVGYFGGSK